MHTVEVYESKESAFTKASPTHHLSIIFNFVPRALLLQCTSGKKLTQPLSYLFVPTNSHQTANLDEENLRWLWNLWTRIKAKFFLWTNFTSSISTSENTKLCLNRFKALKSKFSSGDRSPNPKFLCATAAAPFAAAKETNSEAREPRGGWGGGVPDCFRSTSEFFRKGCRDEARDGRRPGRAGRRAGLWHTRAELGFRIYLRTWIMLQILGTYWI